MLSPLIETCKIRLGALPPAIVFLLEGKCFSFGGYGGAREPHSRPRGEGASTLSSMAVDHRPAVVWLVLLAAAATGYDSAPTTPLPRLPDEQGTVHAKHGSTVSLSLSSLLSSLPPVAVRSDALPLFASLCRQESRSEPALAPVRCLVAGQLNGGRGRAPGAANGAHSRSTARGSSLEEEVRRSGSCILGFGANDAGQLALGHDSSTRVPQMAEGVVAYKTSNSNTSDQGYRVGPPIAAISAGGYHTLLLDLDGSVFSVGENFRGQLGNGWHRLASMTPFLLRVDAKGEVLPPVRGVAAGTCHSIFVTTDGHVYTCGEGCDGRLGLTELDKSSCQGRPVQVSPFVGLSSRVLALIWPWKSILHGRYALSFFS